MTHPSLSLLVVTTCLLVAGCGHSSPYRQSRLHAADRAQLFSGLGTHTRTITTSSAQAQRYFNDGLNWMYAFNHDEAIRCFLRAAQLDPNCAMAWWAVGLCQGPNYNDYLMTDQRSQDAWDALQHALALIDHTTPVERALVEALAARYANPWPRDRSALEQQYADAMAAVYATYPNDPDVATLYAEAMMVRRPWKLYARDYTPAPDTPTIEAVLERAMALDPDNPGSRHLYIHAVEPSRNPDRGLFAADTLCSMVPASGHLLHMPTHIYVKTGRWSRAIVQNEQAMAADDRYRRQSPDQGVQYLYMVHNAHMLAFAAMMSGREREAMAAARAMWVQVPTPALRRVGPYLDLSMCSIYDVQKRFGRWEDILAEPAPPRYLPITRAVWRAHRAVAFAATKDFANAEREYKRFAAAKAALPADLRAGEDPAQKVLEVSDYFIRGEIALQQDEWDRAIEMLTRSAELEDALTYGEPPQWTQPVRHTLGAVYLQANRFQDAERVYREDLTKWRDNGWSLYGLSRALQGQGKSAEARAAEQAHLRAWQQADEPLATSCKCIPRL